MFCKKCGKEIGDNQVMCADCGGGTVSGPPRKMPGWIVVLIVLAVSVPVISIMAGMLLPALNSAREKARRISCTSNLKQISLSLKQYALDEHDSFPEKNGWEGLEQLRANDYMTDYGIYTCPSTSTNSGQSGPLTGNCCDYIYFGGFAEGDSANAPLMFDIPGNHARFFNVAFLDGHVQGFPARDVKNCRELVAFLHSRFQYPPELLNKLMLKADQLDRKYNLK